MSFSIKKKNKKAQRARQWDDSKLHLNPERDWGRIVGVFLFSFIGIAVFSTYIFMRVYNGTAYQDIIITQDGPPKSIGAKAERFQKDITDMLRVYDEKQKSLDVLRLSDTSPRPDPSVMLWVERVATSTSSTTTDSVQQ